MDLPSPIKKALSGKKIILAVVVGLTVSFWMLHSSLSKQQFTKSIDGKGTHVWVDANQNKKVDLNDSKDFKLSLNGDYSILKASDSLMQIEWSTGTYLWLGAAILFMVGRDFFYIVRIRLLTKNKLTWKAGLYVILLWEFASAISPGVVGGAAVAMFILNRETIPFGKATAIVIITAFMDNLFFLFMIPLVFLFVHHVDLFPPESSGSGLITTWFWVGFSVILAVCTLLYLTIFWYPKLATRFLLFVFRLPFLKRWNFIAAEWGKDIEKASKEFKIEPPIFWFKVFLSTFLSWTSRYLVINAILNAFLFIGFIDNIKILGKQLVLWLIMLVSPTPGGSGVAEFAFGELLSTFSSSMILIVALAVLWRVISYFPYLFIGLIILPGWIRRTS